MSTPDTTPETPTTCIQFDWKGAYVKEFSDGHRWVDGYAGKTRQCVQCRKVERLPAETPTAGRDGGLEDAKLIAALTNTNNKLFAERDTLAAQLTQAQQAIADSEDASSLLAQEINSLRQQLAQAQQERDEAKEYINRCAELIQDVRTGVLAGRIANVTADLSSARLTVQQLQRGAREAADFIHTQKQQLAQAQGELATVRAECERLRAALRFTRNEWTNIASRQTAAINASLGPEQS